MLSRVFSYKSLLLLILALFCANDILAANKALVKSVEFDNNNQIQLLVSEKVNYKAFTLKNPDRLVIDIFDAELEDKDYRPKLSFFTTSFRSRQNDESLRLVFDLNQEIKIQKIKFGKVKNQNYSNIIITVIADKKIANTPQPQVKIEKKAPSQDFINQKAEEFDVSSKKVINPDGSAKYVVTKTPKPKKIPIIVIDAGHGGKDPGTIGSFARTKEKNITLSYAKELSKQLANTKKYKVYLTRGDDFFIPLKQRVEKARKIKADIFISLHANAAADESVSGFSIYTLSEKSSDKQAELLAQKENRADIIAGLNFVGASQDIMKTLIDLSQRESKNSSAIFASTAINSIRKSGIEILQNTHRFAGFAVLTAPDMASTLIELGYLSNKEEEQKLNSLSYKRKVAKSLVEAVEEYFSKNKI
jgi:N-acetylmuramoyl-L-alanine amidase